MSRKPLFHDRTEAGLILGSRLSSVVSDENALVLALPRGGVPIGFEIAQMLDADLDVILVRKLGVPGQRELAMGAIASGAFRVLNRSLIEHLRISPTEIDAVTTREQREIERRERLYRNHRPASPVKGRTAILVDDGLATGSSMLAAVKPVRAQQPTRLIVAAPVASHAACEELRNQVDELVCLDTPEPFYAVGMWYQNFAYTSDEDVQNLLERAFERVTHRAGV
jgi:putative phosphoribosyl transferase